MSLDVRDIYAPKEPEAKRARLDDIASLNTATTDAKDILAALENDETLPEDEVAEIDENAVKKLAVQLDKKFKKNQEMRVKHASEPEKFMQSEIELNTAIQEMHSVATAPAFYAQLVELGFIDTVIQLLAHDNNDIVGATCFLLDELCDVEILNENDEEVAGFIDSLLKANLIETFVTQPLAKLDNDDKDEFEAINHVLSTIENILEFRPQASDICLKQGLFVELMNRATLKSVFDSNKLSASQLLAMILQTSEDAQVKLVEKKDGIDFILRALAQYKRNDPESADETEHMENLFDALCASLLRKENRLIFLKDEGNELMYLMLKEKKASREGALRVLSHVTAIPDGVENCNHFVEILGLRALFPLFMKTPTKNKKKDTTPTDHEEHVCSIIESLLYSCNAENRLRVLSKFTEKDYEKVERLVELFLAYSDRLRRFMNRLAKQYNLQEMDDEFISEERRSNGFYTLTKIALILVDVCVNANDGCRAHASNLFRMKTKEASIKAHLEPVLKEISDNLGEEAIEQKNRVEEFIQKITALEEQAKEWYHCTQGCK
uniref:Beta-catenin-like protein 1 n=2 Tax=Panagrellus redivivus TaxID=6233 RepID=A0A7E4ZTT6_PANRE